MAVKFMQFLLPNGERKPVEIDVGEPFQGLADELTAAGWKFEVEKLRTGHIHGDCSNEDGPLANFIVMNGPGVLTAVRTLISDSYAAWEKGGKVRADLFELALEMQEAEEIQTALRSAAAELERDGEFQVWVGETIELRPSELGTVSPSRKDGGN